MTARTSAMTGGANSFQTTSEDLNAHATDFMSDGIIGAVTSTLGVAPTTGGLSMNAQGSPDRTVAIGAGTLYATATPTGQASQRLRVQIAAQNTTHATNVTGSTRFDWIYVKVDATLANAPAVAGDTTGTVVVSRSTSATTDNGTPPTYGFHLGTVTLVNGWTTVVNGNIADTRIRGLASGGVNDSNGNESLRTVATASAVNDVTITNAATTGTPQIAASGDDTNINLKLAGKGTGGVTPVIPYKFRVSRNAAANAGNAVFATVLFDTAQQDTGSNVNLTTGVFTAPVTGSYQFNWRTKTITTGTQSFSSALFVGVTQTSNGGQVTIATQHVTSQGGDMIPLVAGNTVTIQTLNSGAATALEVGAAGCYFSGYLVSV